MEENTPIIKIADKSTHRKANIYFFSKVGINLLLIVIGALLIGLFLRNMQAHTARARQRENNTLALKAVAQIIERNTENADTLTSIYHEGNQKILDDIDLLFSKGLFKKMFQAENNVRTLIFENLTSRIGVQYLFLMSLDDRIVMSGEESLYNTNPAASGHMTQENVNQIINRVVGWTASDDGSSTPVFVQNRFGSFYFYSRPYIYSGRKYALVIGVKASILDEQISSLKDVSSVLSRMAVINDGFLFAVDKRNDLFLYYKNGEELLTGQNALNAGLSKKALEDGYSGIETILGKKYYCTTKAFGDQIVISAAASTESVLSNDRYALFWSILGFALVMIVCLVYAVIVRNDFVRKAVQTDRFILREHSENPIYFDKSVFAKVFPLMLLGVIVMYGISFYTQTLLEITEGIQVSDIALQEISGRYEEGLESREIIENYYNERFLCTARLLSFIVEEDPTAMNTESDHYHSVLDAEGNRKYLLDDEGNRLRSISESEVLQVLCERNNIDAIYIFDENGHTIATSTPNWFFTISRNEEDQSYPFLQVLEGKTDDYVQKPMTNDLGDDTQYFGVAFNYYTAKDEAGNTVYIPRYEYEEAAATGGVTAEGKAGAITKHRSLIQIELDDNLAEKLLTPTDAASILSTNMLGGGAIVMFDPSSDHICLYSPNETSIGKSAAELGVSSKAFSGNNYYGFSGINGTMYFLYFRYLNKYFIATAVPKSSMFVYRGTVALLTAGVCFLLLLILLLTVTLTNKEEELLYETMSEGQAEAGLNAAIFNIILPSGRRAATVKAAARWDNRRITWSEKSPEQKLGIIVGTIFGLLILYLLLSAVSVSNAFQNKSIIHYILSGGWDRNLNIFALSACALVLIGTIIIIALFRVPVRIVTALLGTRGETIGHLLLSILKYGGTLGALFYCLYLSGVDAPSLLASAGILSLVIGLGAQSLIKDILAGIFIVFEGEFRVGDIVTISDFRGTVMDIGLRTTKIMAPNGNIKIFNNSDISGVLNMTKQASVASMAISIEYGQDIEYVEAVLNRELPKLKEKNEKILDGPTYLGISELGESGVELKIMAKCAEQDVFGMTRFLNREVLQIFYRNGINVPFPNVTVSNLDMTGRKTIEDFVPEETAENGQEAGEQ